MILFRNLGHLCEKYHATQSTRKANALPVICIRKDLGLGLMSEPLHGDGMQRVMSRIVLFS